MNLVRFYDGGLSEPEIFMVDLLLLNFTADAPIFVVQPVLLNSVKL